MHISPRGLALIKAFEGCRLTAYLCPAGILTIGFGHTGRDVTEGLRITAEAAEELLRGDLMRFEDGVRRLAGETSQSRFDALVSFAFNLGLGALAGSTLLKRHRAGDFARAANEFLRWNKAGGIVPPGLTRRRAAERRLYLS